MRNVLIVEDDLLMADLLEEVLADDGFRIIGPVQTIHQALDVLAIEEPDFAVIDVTLGNGECGIDIGTALRRTNKARILYSTGNYDDACLSTLVGDAVCSKPYRLRDITQMLQVLDEIAMGGVSNTTLPISCRLLEKPKA